MAFINVFIENACRISVDRERLIVENESKKAVYPIGDINCVLIDCLAINISLYAVNKLCCCGAKVIVCDDKHLPSCVLLPFGGYYKRFSVIKEQADFSKTKIKSLWQSIVKQKLFVQAQCLEQNGKSGYKFLYSLSLKVSKGDSENLEAQGAAAYFKNLFGEDFSREKDCVINACLNYAYSIVRSLICRHLAARGFECSIGIFHKSQFNNFNLADDIIEPFRPVIDNFVYNTCINEENFSPVLKRKLFTIVNLDVIICNQKHSLSNAVEKTAESLLSIYFAKSDRLLMPSLCEIGQYKYE